MTTAATEDDFENSPPPHPLLSAKRTPNARHVGAADAFATAADNQPDYNPFAQAASGLNFDHPLDFNVNVGALPLASLIKVVTAIDAGDLEYYDGNWASLWVRLNDIVNAQVVGHAGLSGIDTPQAAFEAKPHTR